MTPNSTETPATTSVTPTAPALPRRALAVGTLIGALLILMSVLTVSAVTGRGATWMDRPILDWLIAHRNGTLTTLAITASDLGDTLSMTMLTVLGCLLLAWWRRWSQVALVAIAGTGAVLLVNGGKYLVGRERPPVGDRLVHVMQPAFPSGHSLGTIVVVGVLTAVVLSYPRNTAARITLVILSSVFIVAVGWSRLYLAVHWPTDVLGGWTLGGLWLIACLLVHHRYYPAAAPRTTLTSAP